MLSLTVPSSIIPETTPAASEYIPVTTSTPLATTAQYSTVKSTPKQRQTTPLTTPAPVTYRPVKQMKLVNKNYSPVEQHQPIIYSPVEELRVQVSTHPSSHVKVTVWR